MLWLKSVVSVTMTKYFDFKYYNYNSIIIVLQLQSVATVHVLQVLQLQSVVTTECCDCSRFAPVSVLKLSHILSRALASFQSDFGVLTFKQLQNYFRAIE